MAIALQAQDELLSPHDYLEREALEEAKHEYLGGVVYAMPGASETHNQIAANLMGVLYNELRGHSCRFYGSDMKVTLRLAGDTYYYYPDAMVACDPTDAGHGWRERPAVLFEIISEDTRRTDEREKRMAYHQIESLQAYVRLEQTRAELVIETRAGDGWRTERFSGLDAVAHLSEPALTLRLVDLYEHVDFSAPAEGP